jgi:hypothetical protein
MSYDIVYERNFLKMEDGRIIPLVLVGANNVYDSYWSGNRSYYKRTRDWACLFVSPSGSIAHTPEGLLDVARSSTGGVYQEHFKFRNKWIDDAGLLRFVKNGIKRALTIEELNELSAHPIVLHGSFVVYRKTGEFYPGGYEKSSRDIEHCVAINDSKDLSDFIKVAEDREMHKDSKETIYVALKYDGEKAIPYPKEKRGRTKRERPDKYWLIVREDGAYLKRLTRTGAKLTFWENSAKWFSTEKQATRYIENYRINSRFTSGMKYKPVLHKESV